MRIKSQINTDYRDGGKLYNQINSLELEVIKKLIVCVLGFTRWNKILST